MIVDQILLAGDSGRFQAPGAADPFDLAGVDGGATIGPLPEGSMLEVTGVALTLQRQDIEELFARRQKPLITVTVRKEMFRGLYADPYGHRVYTVAGFEDLRRGDGNGLEALEVDGIPTLVSVGGDRSEWLSGIYPLPATTNFSGVAWDVAASRHTHDDAFRYWLDVLLWPGNNFSVSPDVVPAAVDYGPTKPMYLLKQFKGDAFQLRFRAEVNAEGAFHERHRALPQDVSLGTPLLRSVHLLEPVTPAYSLLSLLELQVRSREFIVHRGKAGEAPSQITAVVDLPCHLGQGERINVGVAPGVFKRVEAWLVATQQTRPPIILG